MDIDAILKYKRPKETYYDILGCHSSSTVEQINREYKIRALQLHPDKNLNTQTDDQFRRLQQAKEILADPASRKLYDTWLGSGIQIPFEQWRARSKGHSMHWAPPRSVNLPIREAQNDSCTDNTISSASTGQGSDMNFKINNDLNLSRQEANNLEKFRKYQI